MNQISQIVKSQAPKAYGIDHNPQPKQLGPQGSGDSSQDLGTWYTQAYAYYQAVQSGQEPQPEAAAWQELLNQMNWAYQQLWGSAGGTNQWGNQMDPGAPEETPDPSGAMKGPGGNYILNEEKNEVGFVGGGRVYDMWGPYNTIHIAPYSAEVTVVKTQDDSVQPPEEIIKIKVVDKATGEESIYNIRDVEGLEELNILAANMDNVDIQFQDDRVNVGKFEKGGMAEGGGVPEDIEIEDGVGYVEGMMGSWTELQVPFGNLERIVSYGDTDISVRSSDEVLVELMADGTTKVTVTDRNGEVVSVIEVDAGSKVNINAKPDHVTFKDGGAPGTDFVNPSVGGNIGDLAAPGDEAPKRTNPDSGPTHGEIPEGEEWAHITLNGQASGNTGPENANPDMAEWPDAFLDLLDEMGIDPQTTPLELSESMKELLENGLFTYNTKAMKDLLDTLAKDDSGLAAALEALGNNDTKGNRKLVRDRLIELLNAAFGNKLSPLSEGDLPEGAEMDAKEMAQYMIHDNGTIYRIKIGDNGKIRLEEIDENNIPGVEEPLNEEDLSPMEQDAYDTIQRLMDNLPGFYADSAEDVLAWADEKGYTSELANPVLPGDFAKLVDFLLEYDEGLKSAWNNFKNDPDHDEVAFGAFRDQLVEGLSVLCGESYEIGGAGVTDGKDEITFTVNGQKYKMFEDWGKILGKEASVPDSPIGWDHESGFGIWTA